MKKIYYAINMMMEMYMWTCCMCMTCCASISDMFSILEEKHCTAS